MRHDTSHETGRMPMRRLRPSSVLPTAIAAIGLLLLGAAPADAKTFINSDDYEEGDEIVGVFLTDDDYRIMVDDLERRDQEFDWGFALTAGWQPGQKPRQEAKNLGFDLADYATIRIPAVENFAGIMQDDELEEVRDAFVLAAEQLGLEVVDGAADLELAVGIVDVNREGGGFGIFKVDPFIEMEFRLRDLGGDRDLLLIRHQKHSETPGGSALATANTLVQFLR